MQEEYSNTHHGTKDSMNWIEKIKRYKLHLTVVSAIAVVGVSAFAHYKNESIKEELVKSIEEYQKSLVLIGADLGYESVECSGIITTDCEIKKMSLSIMGQEQMSIQSLRLGNVEEYREFKAFSKGKTAKASIDIEADEIILPKPLMAQIVAQNVSELFQANVLEKMVKLNLAFSGEFEGNSSLIKYLNVERFVVDNPVMPIEFSMEAKQVSGSAPDAMVLESFSFSAENRAIRDVAYESVKQLYHALHSEEKAILLKEFSLQASDIDNKSKASAAINGAIAKQLENDADNASGFVEKELIMGMAKVLRGEAKEIALIGKNQKNLTVAQVQNLLLQSASMNEAEAKAFMQDKFTIDVKID